MSDTPEETYDPLLWTRDSLYEARYGKPRYNLDMADKILTEYRESLDESDMRPADEQMKSALALWRQRHPK